ncbi:hypothetical protein PAXRUDRAFT_828872 [Paxillus rubicundulus Ve08.2h10]|uniref:Uncharacterized protein n=1 Tax=Paxillus rubicundulus Ve08.2h10 TaxID=930991 RepID=A0A0D0E6W3_9AGAM|nr:hypothetical protein PAXRUDRAFT_828872 [Paxillus rubicundulus Ve08.2h10]
MLEVSWIMSGRRFLSSPCAPDPESPPSLSQPRLGSSRSCRVTLPLPPAFNISDRVLILAKRHPSSRRRSWHRGIIRDVITCASCRSNTASSSHLPNPDYNDIPPTNDLNNSSNPFEPRTFPHYHYKVLFHRHELNLIARIWRYPIRRRLRTVCHWKIPGRVLPDDPASALWICLSGRTLLG